MFCKIRNYCISFQCQFPQGGIIASCQNSPSKKNRDENNIKPIWPWLFFNVCGRKRIWRQLWKKIWEIADKNALGKAVCEKNLSYNVSWISVGSRYRIQYDGEGAVWLYKVLFSEQSPRPVISASLGKRNQHSLFHVWLWNRVCCVEKSEPGVELPGNSSASRFCCLQFPFHAPLSRGNSWSKNLLSPKKGDVRQCLNTSSGKKAMIPNFEESWKIPTCAFYHDMEAGFFKETLHLQEQLLS